MTSADGIMEDGETSSASDPASAGAAARRHFVESPLWVLVAGLVFLILVAVFPRASDEVTEITGVPCDRSQQTQIPCEEVDTTPDDRVAETALAPEERPFVRITKPSSEIIAWSGLGAFAVVSSLALAAAARLWRKELGDFAPGGSPSGKPARFGARRRSNVLSVAALLFVGIVAAGIALLSRDYVQATILVVLWISAAPTILSALDCRSIAETETWLVGESLTDQVAKLRQLGRLHERFVALLGGQVTIYVLWLSADVQVKGKTAQTELARQGGEFLNSPYAYGVVVVWGAFLTGLLALAYFPAASDIRRHAEHLIDETLAGMDDAADYAEANKQRAALAARLGADQPLQARFQGAVIVAAPLATSLFSSLIGG